MKLECFRRLGGVWVALVLGTLLTAPAQARSLPDFSELVESSSPVVVNISTTQKIKQGAGLPPGMQIPDLPEDSPFNDLFKHFFGEGQGEPIERDARSLGSGVIISADGYVLTNNHVVKDAEEIIVRLTDHRELVAAVIGTDERSDIALLKIEADSLPVAKLGRSEDLKVGEWVLAIGSPFGFERSATAGIVSAKGRALPRENYVPFIQTDVAINPGNSGGPLFNMDGEVVGVNSQIFSRTGGYMGLSFAIPIEVAMDVAKQLQTQGRVTRARLGVRIQEVTKELAQSFGLDSAAGVLVAWVEPGGPAEKAGLTAGDIVLKFNNEPIEATHELPRLVASAKPGTQATLEVWRKGARQQITATLGELPSEPPVQKAGGAPPVQPNTLGLVVSELPPAQRKALGIAFGLLVEDVRGAATNTPVRPGDVIIGVNQARLTSLQQFNEILSAQKPGASVALQVRRGDDVLYVPIKIGS